MKLREWANDFHGRPKQGNIVVIFSTIEVLLVSLVKFSFTRGTSRLPSFGTQVLLRLKLDVVCFSLCWQVCHVHQF